MGQTRTAHPSLLERFTHTHTCMESLELVWLFVNASCATPMLGQPRRTFSHKKKTCLSISPPPRVLHHTNTQQPECSSTSPTLNLSNLQHQYLRSPAICTRVSASFASLVFAHTSSYAPPSQHNPLHSTLGQQTTQALPDDDAVTDTTTDTLLRNGRDLTVRAERSTLGLRPSHLGKLSLPAHASRAVISRCPK